MNYANLASEGVVVGLVLAVLGRFVQMDSFSMRFLSGVVIHLGFEFLHFNKWYCKHGAACKKI